MKLNLVSYALTDDSYAALKQKLTETMAIIDEFAIELHIDDKKTLQAMGDRSVPFTDYAYYMATEQKDVLPKYLDLEEFKKDITLFRQTKEILQTVEIIKERLIDTHIAAGSDAFSTARKFYTLIKAAVKSNIPGATVTYNEMRNRYLKIKHKEVTDDQTTKPSETKATASESTEAKKTE